MEMGLNFNDAESNPDLMRMEASAQARARTPLCGRCPARTMLPPHARMLHVLIGQLHVCL
jgi:hypothetical protein